MDDKTYNLVKERIREILINNREGISIEFEIYDKWVIFTEMNFIKLEIGIKNISEAQEDVSNIIESRVSNPEQVIMYDKNNRVQQIYTDNWIDLNDSKRLKGLFIEDVNKFLYYFEGFLSNLAKDDEYKAYMNYTIAFYKLAGLKAMIEGEFYNLYQPRKFTTAIIDDRNLRAKYYKASAGLRKYDMLNQRDNLKSLYLEVLNKGVNKFEIESELISVIQKFFTKVDEKFLPFKNFRDISLIPNHFSNRTKIKEGLIYRGASLSKNNTDTILKFFKEKQINYVLDLRGEKELENYIKYNSFYEDEIKEKYVINIPIETEVNIYLPDKPYENFYYAFLKDYNEKFRIIFEDYFAKASTDRLIIHCEGGKDRTGMVIALLLDLLKIERELIIEDYLLSFNDTKLSYIEFLFKTIDKEYGGTEKFLVNHCNASKESINTIREALVEKY